jgi:hypothetical protein
MKTKLFPFLILLLLSLGACKKHRLQSNGLPPATQQGKNTLGFILNGQAWMPKGFNGTANLSIDVDFGFNDGIFNIVGYRTINSTTEQFTIGISDSLNTITIPHTFIIFPNSVFGISYTKNPCDYFSKESTTISQGTLIITKLDRINKIISGTFNGTLSKSGCETIQITEGRFDMKF